MTTADKIIAYVDGQAIPEPTECFAVPGASSIIDCIHPLTGKTIYYGQTLEEVRQRPGYERAERMLIDDFCRDKAARQDRPWTWYEITEEQYQDWFECLPPAAYGPGRFLLGEVSDHHAATGAPRYQACKQADGKFYASSRPLTVKEFKERTA